jgi:MoxR-like ATPase
VTGTHARIQFTPDLLPSDVTGVTIYDQHKHEFEFHPGPIFHQIVLVDEINRASAKTQAALLEVMEEGHVTIDGVTHSVPHPFMVIATQNPIEQAGTYRLPEAQLDRFLMKILVRYPSREDLSTIVTRTTQKEEAHLRTILNREEIMELRRVCRDVLVAPHVQSYAIDLVMATQPDSSESHELAKKFIRFGSSPRGAQALVECGQVLALMRGRLHLSIEDVQTVAAAVLRHRIILNFDAHADGQTPETILDKIIPSVVAARAGAKV